MGLVAIDGYERYRTYYKDLFDKLGVEINLFRVGAYKSAAEVYVRTDMSPEDREESLAYLNALWLSYRTAVAEARGLTPTDISDYVANLVPAMLAAKGNAAKVALDAKLVTGLKSSLDVERRMVALVGGDSPKETEEKVEAGESDAGESYNSTSLEDYLRVVEAEKQARGLGKDKIGVIIASGEILDGSQPPGTVGGETAAMLIREAREDDDVKAIVLRVDSPGGSVFASEQIYREVRAAQADGKPVVVSMGDLAASGGYYIAALGRRDLGASGHHHRLHRHLRRDSDLPEHAQEDRRERRRRGHHQPFRPAAHRSPAGRGRQSAAAVVHRARLRRISRARRRRPQEDPR